MTRPLRQHAYCYKDRRYVVAGTTIPAPVVDRVLMDMRQGQFRGMDVARFCEHALRFHGGPVSCAQALADRIIRDCKDSRSIRLAVDGRIKTWEWSGA